MTTEQKILEYQRLYEILTDPTIAMVFDKRNGSPARRVRVLKKLGRRLDDLEFALEMERVPVREPDRKVTK